MSVVIPTRSHLGRWRELFLCILVLIIGIGGYALLWKGLGEKGLPANFVLISSLSTCAVLGTHILLRFFAPHANPVFFPSALALNALGLVMIYRIDQSNNETNAHTQLIATCIGLICCIITVATVRNYRILRSYKWTSLVAGIIFLLLPLSPLGVTLYGSRLWIRLAGFSFQPAEIAKIFFAVFFAAYLVTERDNLSLAGPKILGIRFPKGRHILPILLAWGLSMVVLVFQKDFGTALLFFGLFVAILWVATERLSWLIIGGILTLAGVIFIATNVSHVRARFNIWLDAFNPDLYNAKGGSYQVVQGLFGMGSGGLFGTGLGEGYPGIVFAAHSDYIYTSFAEELGLVGVLAILCIYLLLLSRGMRVALTAKDGFSKLLAAGLSFGLALQCFIVIGGVTRVIPLTGLALPFLAHGGSALIANWIIIGLLIRMSDTARRPAQAVALPTTDELERINIIDDDSAASSSPIVSSSDVLKDGPHNSGQETEVVKL
ncbi:FtsW/RodA/SpoVE family cell cycle protein [Actinotignum urinale]|uniref:FtsW/RodA/SpoVE family cell cycle protein n=1 Tax=Actinotignum urinale TaxID=190146 RepID=UPI000C803BF4|nr:FtsW/RodA/SpoVE family cell cycle protein [Actinotignum urinale]WIK59580.1 FtsW/RodA/SpoVE family cell cycle protein [Actinotignum urinale]